MNASSTASSESFVSSASSDSCARRRRGAAFSGSPLLPALRLFGLTVLCALGSIALAQSTPPDFVLQDAQVPSTVEVPANPEPPAGAEVVTGTVPAAVNVAAANANTDPPARVLRLSLLNGDVSVEPAGENEFTPAELNGVLTTGDRVYADTAAEAELEAGQTAVRLGGGADLTVTAMTDTLTQFGVAAGSVHLRSYAITPGTVLELDSPEAAVTVLEPGDVRVDVDTATHTTTVALLSGHVQVDSPGSSQFLTPGGRIRLHGEDSGSGQAAFAESLPVETADSLDTFSDTRDNLQASGADAAGAYLNPDTVGGADLGSSGSWDSSDFGPVWYPVVSVEWHPYSHGHWRFVAPWGWTWVGTEPWGFAPFHYGRWAHFGDGIGGRWGWIPGPRAVRPVYAPAMVVFAGGPQFASSLGYPPGIGLAAWFPLGPREPYVPPYRGSTLYLNRVNVSNIYDGNTAAVRGLYKERTVSVFSGTPSPSRGYVNRGVGTTAVSGTAFAAGRSVGNSALRLPAATLAEAPLLLRPATEPARSVSAPRAVVALPPVLSRPVLSGGPLPAGHGGALGVTTLFHRAEPPAPAPGYGVGAVHAPGSSANGVRLPAGHVPAPVHSAPPPPRAAPAPADMVPAREHH